MMDLDEMAVVVLGLADRVGRRLRAKGRTGSTLTVRVRFPGPRSVSRSHTLPTPTGSTSALSNLGMTLLESALCDSPGERVTLIGLSMSNLTTDAHLQLELDLGDGDELRAGSERALKRSSLEGKVDEIREKFGRDLLRYGTGSGGASDEFRRLAERS